MTSLTTVTHIRREKPSTLLVYFSSITQKSAQKMLNYTWMKFLCLLSIYVKVLSSFPSSGLFSCSIIIFYKQSNVLTSLPPNYGLFLHFLLTEVNCNLASTPNTQLEWLTKVTIGFHVAKSKGIFLFPFYFRPLCTSLFFLHSVSLSLIYFLLPS